MTTRFNLSIVAANLDGWGLAPRRSSESIAWTTQWGESEIRVQRLGIKTRDGLAMNEVVLLYFTPAGAPLAVTAERVAEANVFSSLSAIVVGSTESAECMASRVTIFDGDDEAVARIYEPLITTEAYMQPALFAASLRGSGPGPEYFGLSGFDDVSPIQEVEFVEATERMRAAGVYATAHATGLAAEFPWDPEAISMGLGARLESSSSTGQSLGIRLDQSAKTWLLQLETERPHPWLGRGLLCRLDMPVGPFAEPWKVASELNSWELQAIDMPPFFGSWCVKPGATSPTFVCFIPNELCRRASVSTICAWMSGRARNIQQVVQAWLE